MPPCIEYIANTRSKRNCKETNVKYLFVKLSFDNIIFISIHSSGNGFCHFKTSLESGIFCFTSKLNSMYVNVRWVLTVKHCDASMKTMYVPYWKLLCTFTNPLIITSDIRRKQYEHLRSKMKSLFKFDAKWYLL